MFGFGGRRRRTSVQQIAARPNGWTPDQIARLEGMSSIQIDLTSFTVTTAMKAGDYAAAVRIAADELEAYQRMPLLFRDAPVGQTQEQCIEWHIEAEGACPSIGVAGHLELRRATFDQIGKEGHAGWVELTALGDLGNPETWTPLVQFVIHDVDFALAAALRASFVAWAAGGSRPALKAVLRKPITWSIASQGDAGVITGCSTTHYVDKALVFEHWGPPPQ